MIKMNRVIAAAGCAALAATVLAIGPGAGASGVTTRLYGNGERNNQFLTVDVKVVGSTMTGVLTLGSVDGTEVCSYTAFSKPKVSSTNVNFDARGDCTSHLAGFAFGHAKAHHRISITYAGTNGPDLIDVNAYADSPEGIAIPGGPLAVGDYAVH